MRRNILCDENFSRPLRNALLKCYEARGLRRTDGAGGGDIWMPIVWELGRRSLPNGDILDNFKDEYEVILTMDLTMRESHMRLPGSMGLVEVINPHNPDRSRPHQRPEFFDCDVIIEAVERVKPRRILTVAHAYLGNDRFSYHITDSTLLHPNVSFE